MAEIMTGGINQGDLKPLAEFVADLKEKSLTLDVKPLPGATRGEVIIHDRLLGKYEIHTPDPAPRVYHALDLKSIATLVKATALGKVMAFVGPEEVMVLLDEDGDRRDRVRFKLEYSEFWKTICTLEKLPAMTQREIVDLLRMELCIPTVPESLGSDLRQIKFSVNTAGQSSVQQGRESMGKSIDANLTGADQLPDDVTFSVPVYSNVFAGVDASALQHWTVECDLRVSIADQKFVLRPKAGQIEAVKQAAGLWLCEQVAKVLKDQAGAVVVSGICG